MDYSDRKTNQMLGQLEKDLGREYTQAWSELKVKTDKYFLNFAERYEREYAAFEDGAYTEEQFKRWYAAQVGRGEAWEAMRDDMAQRMVDTNVLASSMINDTSAGVYSLNANWQAYTIDIAHPSNGIAWNLTNQSTVKRMMTGKNHVTFRITGIRKKMDYDWNQKQISRALLQGILQGDSPYEIADRFLQVMGRNRTAAIRNARTAITSAQNAGKLDSCRRAVESGINIKKQWLSTNDDRTRDSHYVINGEMRDIDEPFSNGLMYPGDPDGEPGEVYNCRCTLITVDPIWQNKDITFSKTEFDKWLKEE